MLSNLEARKNLSKLWRAFGTIINLRIHWFVRYTFFSAGVCRSSNCCRVQSGFNRHIVFHSVMDCSVLQVSRPLSNFWKRYYTQWIILSKISTLLLKYNLRNLQPFHSRWTDEIHIYPVFTKIRKYSIFSSVILGLFYSFF